MICPKCKAEYRQGFTRCSDCEVELVESYVEAAHHPLAKRVVVGDEFGARLWHGTDPHFYVGLLSSLWSKRVSCYGVPEYPQIAGSLTDLQSSNSEPAAFEVWVSEENLPLAKWILESDKEEFEMAPLEEPGARVKATVDEVSPETNGVCPLCFSEFTRASSLCPNCGVALHSPQAEVGAENSASELCHFGHPRFMKELREALRVAGIPFNNASVSYGDVISGWSNSPNYGVLVLKKDFERATRVMSQVLQHWEFEPGAGFRVGRDSFLDYWPERAWHNGWLPEDITALVWSGENIGLVGGIGLAFQEHEIAYRVDTGQIGTAKVFSHPEDEARAREIVREIVEGAPPE
jgi:hypothetical protein